jgi:hypothetical protein
MFSDDHRVEAEQTQKKGRVVHGYCVEEFTQKNGMSTTSIHLAEKKNVFLSTSSTECRKQPFELLILFNHYG